MGLSESYSRLRNSLGFLASDYAAKTPIIKDIYASSERKKIMGALNSEGTRESLRKLLKNFYGAGYDKKLGEVSGPVLYDSTTNSLKFRVKAAPEYKKLNGYLKEMERGDCSHAGDLARFLEDRLEMLSIEARTERYRERAHEVIDALDRLPLANADTGTKDNSENSAEQEDKSSLNGESLHSLIAWYRERVVAAESMPTEVYKNYASRSLIKGSQLVGIFHCHKNSKNPSKTDIDNSLQNPSGVSLVIYDEGKYCAGICYLSRGKFEHHKVKLYDTPFFSIKEWLWEVENADYTHLKDLINILEDKRTRESEDRIAGRNRVFNENYFEYNNDWCKERRKIILERGQLNAIIDVLTSCPKEGKNQNLIEACYEYRSCVFPELEKKYFNQREKIKKIGKDAAELKAELERPKQSSEEIKPKAVRQ